MLPVQTSLTKQLTIGGYTFDWDPKNNPSDVLLTGDITFGTTAFHTTLQAPVGGAGYQVPSGKTLTIVAARQVSASSTGGYAGFGYGDNDVGVGGAIPTNQVLFGRGSPVCTTAGAGGAVGESGGLNFQVPSLKYPEALTSGSASERTQVLVYCKLS
jgi:hypothetical protein